MVRDIRDLTDERDAYADELSRRWGGLLSYRYIGRQYASMDPRAVENTVTLRHDMRNSTGGIMAGPLCILAVEPYWRDDECVPAPVTMTEAPADGRAI